LGRKHMVWGRTVNREVESVGGLCKSPRWRLIAPIWRDQWRRGEPIVGSIFLCCQDSDDLVGAVSTKVQNRVGMLELSTLSPWLVLA
jgi:hypothetical protein